MRPRLLLAAAALGVMAPVGIGAAEPACAADEEVEVAVAVVVDFGPLEGPSRSPSATCVSVPPGASGTDVLAARARQLGTPPPRYDDSGLLCAIDGRPATGCGQPSGDGYRYWAYFQGTDAVWAYASEGPATREATAQTAEGWHFVDGSGMPTDPPPSGDADPQRICETARALPASRPRDGADDAAPVGFIAGAGLAVVLAGAGWWMTRRRAREAGG